MKLDQQDGEARKQQVNSELHACSTYLALAAYFDS